MFASALESITGFAKRHKNKLLVVGALAAVGGGAYYLWNQASTKFQQDQKRHLQIQRMKHLFESNRTTADTALRALLPQIRDKLYAKIDLESLLASLKSQTNAPSSEDKKKIWEQIKVDSFTRLIMSVYSLSLTHLFFSLQVNMIGRYIFVRFLEKANNNDAANDDHDNDDTSSSIPKDVQRSFLSLADYFQTQGMNILLERVQHHVQQTVGPMSLSQHVSATDCIQMIEQICANLNDELKSTNNQADTTCLLGRILLPPEQQQQQQQAAAAAATNSNDILQQLINELRDLFESETLFAAWREGHVECLQVLFDHMEKMVAHLLRKKDDKGVAFASLVPRVAQECKTVFHTGTENEYIRSMQETMALQRFFAMVYSSGIEL